RDAAGERELPEQLAHAFGISGDVWIDLAVGALEIGIGYHARTAMAGATHIDHVEVESADHAIEMGIDEVQARRRPPMAEQARLDVLSPQRFAQQGIVEQIDLADRKVV